VTVSELLHGVGRATGATRAKRAAFVEHLLAGFEAIPITESVARVHAEIWAQLTRRGQTIGAHDLWIAATAVAYGLSLVTLNDADLGGVPGLHCLRVGRSRAPTR
jgi:tRNA(fMet)-specific endonuclease VapC